MKPSNTKKRRLAALNQYQGSASEAPRQHAAQAKQQQQAQAAQGPVLQQHSAGVPAATASSAGPTESAELGVFPYNPLSSTQSSSHTAAKLQIPSSSKCTGTVEDLLEQLMTTNMPPHIARNMIATRTIDKFVVLDNPTAKLNITKPSKASKGRRQQLASKLLPRAKRKELSELPTSGLNFAALTALHELWGKYMSDLLVGKPEVERLLQTADWHGAIVTVADHKNKIHTGKSGIVAKATANTFVIVSVDGRSSVVPLKGGVFECVVPGINLSVALQGSSQAKLQCTIKAAEGAK